MVSKWEGAEAPGVSEDSGRYKLLELLGALHMDPQSPQGIVHRAELIDRPRFSRHELPPLFQVELPNRGGDPLLAVLEDAMKADPVPVDRLELPVVDETDAVATGYCGFLFTHDGLLGEKGPKPLVGGLDALAVSAVDVAMVRAVFPESVRQRLTTVVAGSLPFRVAALKVTDRFDILSTPQEAF